MRRLFLGILLVFLMCMSCAQQGPYVRVEITPALWTAGCTPTSFAMWLSAYSNRGWDVLVDGDVYKTADTLAQYFNTNNYGSTDYHDVQKGLRHYLAGRGYWLVKDSHWGYDGLVWHLSRGIPMVLFLDTNSDGDSDHAVTCVAVFVRDSIIGYYDTYSCTIRWKKYVPYSLDHQHIRPTVYATFPFYIIRQEGRNLGGDYIMDLSGRVVRRGGDMDGLMPGIYLVKKGGGVNKVYHHGRK